MSTASPRPLDQDIHRPRYHFLPAANWMNDPNGVIHWQEQYHLFYQYNPDGAYHANIHWGHAVSPDLVHWRELPIAIAPTPDSPDQGGVFSGCMVDDGGAPTAIYTGVNDDYSVQTQCLAAGNADLTRWEKHAGNPVIGEAPPELGQRRDFRDPFVWRSDDCWYMLLASHIVGVGGAALLYRSPDLRRWEYRHPLFVGERARHGANFECPNFFPLGDKWALLVSMQPAAHVAGVTLYFVGRFEDERFIPEGEGVYDVGYSYASLVHQDDAGRRLAYSWIREGRSKERQLRAGWTGLQAIPRELSLDGRNRLLSCPVPALETLRRRHWRIESGGEGVAVESLSLDMAARFDGGASSECGLEIDMDGATVEIVYQRNSRVLQVRRQYEGDEPELDCHTLGAPHNLDPGEALELRVLLDGSALEVIANGRTRITSRVYPAGGEKTRIRVQGGAALQSLDVWEMASIW